jgi:hypothetical protein
MLKRLLGRSSGAGLSWRSGLSLSVLALMLLAGVKAGQARAAERAARNSFGIAVGIPQTVAIEYGRALSSRAEFCVHAGSVALLSSAGARLRWGRIEPGIRPYAFLGGAVIHAEPDKPGDPDGATSYVWLGPGFAWRTPSWRVFGEVSALLGGNEDRGLGDTNWVFPFNPAISGGIAIRF